MTTIKKIEDEKKSPSHGEKVELAGQIDKVNLLSKALCRTRKVDVKENKVVRQPEVERIKPHQDELDFYNNVTEIVCEYGDSRDISGPFILAIPQQQISSSMPAALRYWQREYANDIDALINEECHDNEEFEECHDKPLLREPVRKASGLADVKHLIEIDTKYSRLIDTLKNHFSERPNEKVILFAYFNTTLEYLQGRLNEDGITSILLTGKQGKEKSSIIDEFKNQNRQILLASEVASEGIDLQFCRVIINYDLPWNPMKIEQRIGRLDRIGQKSESISIWNLLTEGTIDERIYDRLYERLDIFQRSLGDLDPILGEEVAEIRKTLLDGRLTAEEKDNRVEKTALAMQKKRKDEEELERQAPSLTAHGDFIINKIKEAKDMEERRITDSDLYFYAVDFFNEYYPGCQVNRTDDKMLEYEILLTDKARFEFSEYISKLPDGLTKLVEGKTIKCLFDNHVASKEIRRGVEIINHFHPLIKYITHIRNNSDDKFKQPMSLAKLDREHMPDLDVGAYFCLVDKWSVEGLRPIKRMNYVVTSITEQSRFVDEKPAERLINLTSRSGARINHAFEDEEKILLKDSYDRCVVKSEEDYEKFMESEKNENMDRADIQLGSLERRYKNEESKLDTRLYNASLVTDDSKRKQRAETLARNLIKNEKEKYERKKFSIEKRRDIKLESERMCASIVILE